MRHASRHGILLASLTCVTLAANVAPASGQAADDRPASARPLRDLVERQPLDVEIARNLAIAKGNRSGSTPPRRDSLLNGVLIGAGVGALLGLIPDHYDDCEECHDSLYASIAVGAGIGLLVDALRTGRPAASPAIRSQAVPVGVVVGRGRIGVGTRIRWP